MGAGRKQATRRASRRARLAQRRAALAPYREKREQASESRTSRAYRDWGWLITIPLLCLIIAWLLYDQVQIARVMIAGHPTHAMLVAANPCQSHSWGDFTVTFTDIHGVARTVRHSSYTMFCDNRYHVGASIPIRYLPSDPTVLMTQAELDDLTASLATYGVADFLFLGGPALLFWFLFLPWAFQRWIAPHMQDDPGQGDSGAAGGV